MRQIFLFSCVCVTIFLLQAHAVELRTLSSSVQTLCSERLHPVQNEIRSLYQALACGTDLPIGSEWRTLLVRTGLYHAIVVSGSHLVLLEIVLRKSRYLWLAAGALTLMTGLQPPLVRGLLQRYAPLVLDGPAKVFAVHMLSLVLFPSWFGSTSLSLSTAACMGLCVRGPKFMQFTLPWLMTIPLVIGFSPVHPLQLFCHLLFSGFITFILIPLAYLRLMLPTLPTDFVFNFLKNILISFANLNTSQALDTAHLSHWQISFYLFALFALTHLWNRLSVRWSRK